MPVIQTYDPLGQGLEAAGAFVQGSNDARDKALALARAREQTEYDRGEDQKRDKSTQDEFVERKSEFGQTHALDVQTTESNIAHTQHQDKISDAVEATRAAMAPILRDSQILQLQISRGQIQGQALDNAYKSIENRTAKAQADIEDVYGKPMAQIALSQAQANIGSTYASTASTVANTNRSNALLPGELAQQDVTLQGGQLANQYSALQNKYAPAMFNNDLAAARANVDKATDTSDDKDYKAQLSAATRHQADFDRAVAAKKYKSDGKGGYTDPAGNPVTRPADPLSPTDFRASISDEVDAIFDPTKRTDPDMPTNLKTATPEDYAQSLIKQTANNPALSVSQKREAVLVIRSAMQRMKSGGLMSVPGGAGGSFDLNRGGSNAAPPFPG